MELEEKYYSKKELMQYLSVSLSTINKWQKAGKLEIVKVGKRVLIPASSVKAILDNKK